MNKMQRYLLEGIMCAFLFLFLSWAIGYYANAIYNTKFDLASCWGGFTALGGAGVLAAIKYIFDSLANSDKGQMPYVKKEE